MVDAEHSHRPHGGKAIPKGGLSKQEQDVVNSMQNRVPTQDGLIAGKITRLLQQYSLLNHRNGQVLQMIRAYVKHNVESFSLIRLCVCVNYFLNLKMEGDRSFNFVITNSFVKKIKNDEFLDLYGVCLIAKFILRERVTHGGLLSLLASLVRSKADETSSPLDVYNLVVSLLSIQSGGLLRGGQAATQGGTQSTSQTATQTATQTAAQPAAQPATQLNEQNVHTLLQLYLQAEKVKNDQLILIVNTLSGIDRTAFFHQMDLAKGQRVQLYEALLRRVNLEERFDGKVLALFLFSLQRMVKLGEISEGVFFHTVVNLAAAFREAAVGTKRQAMRVHSSGAVTQKWGGGGNPQGRENRKVAPKGVEVPTGGGPSGPSGIGSIGGMGGLDGNPVGEVAQVGGPPSRTHFNLQEIGMVLQFYGALVGVPRGRRSSPGKEGHVASHSVDAEDSSLEDSAADHSFVASLAGERTRLGKLYGPSVLLLKESLLLYAQASYEKKVKMNTLDFCTLLKGLSSVFQNTLLDRNILPIFRNFLKHNGKRITIKELQRILKLIFEKREMDFFPFLCGGKNCSFFDHLHSVLLRSVLSESPSWWNEERVEACIMCFYYMSFLSFNANTYLVVNQFVLEQVTGGRAVALVPYVVLSRFNYHRLEVRAAEAAGVVTVADAAGVVTVGEAAGGARNDRLPQTKHVTDDFDRMDRLYQLINRHLEKYKTFFVLNCIYALTKFLKNNRTSAFPPFSKFHFPELFHKLNDRLFMHSGLERQSEGKNHIPTSYDYFVNYVKYNYCLSFLCLYVDLGSLLQRVPLGVEFPFAFYTPFNAYLTAAFLANYERLLGSGGFAVPRGASEGSNEAVRGATASATASTTAFTTNATALPFARELVNPPRREIQMEKKKLLKSVMKYASAHCKVMSVHDLIHLIKAFKLVAPLMGRDSLTTLHTCMSIFTRRGNVKTSTSFELLTELIKFMYHFELQNGEVFDDCHDKMVDMLILTFRIVFKNLPDRADSNYLGMLQFSLLYVSHFVRGANLVFDSLSLTDLKRADYFTGLSPMNLDKYPQSSCTFQLQILKVLKGVVKNEKRLLNEYRVGDTPYTVDILIT
ncbi:hypothetical protein, conserved [Plasmodium vivax]|uniref:Uncharacterized protein n=1 Tax=Plasmodium vivax (strain Salvador I) TaxID=126793 RepID=A5K4W8_PLAVS|nr:hypothetical protein, conserved [Plasmodium vivax]EDL45696.1 hypothetical protein, conserved [Plasmodium vivax]|eukprot:XP_001615423.1 hypothetical protein [Plasmodium vivax Sal-1]